MLVLSLGIWLNGLTCLGDQSHPSTRGGPIKFGAKSREDGLNRGTGCTRVYKLHVIANPNHRCSCLCSFGPPQYGNCC